VGTSYPNTDNDERTTLETEEKGSSSTSTSDEVLKVKKMTDTLSDLE